MVFYNLKHSIKKAIPRRLILLSHKLRAIIAAFFYRFPGKKIRVIGVSGTKGKTTTTNLIAHILEEAGFKVAMFSTANMRMVGEESLNMLKLTTPSPFFLSKFLRDAVEKKCDCAVLEVSSHAISQHRLYGIDFKTVVITNLMPDHLDYHKNADEYRDIHLKMFRNKTEAVIINGEEEESLKFKSQISPRLRSGQANLKSQNFKIITFGLGDNNDLQAYDVKLNSGMVKFKVKYHASSAEIISDDARWSREGISRKDFVLNIPGQFSVYNALAAIALGASEVIEPGIINKALAGVSGVPGRLERIKVNPAQDFEVIVDYAHSPDSLKTVYEAVKPYVKNRLIAVLGGTGDRDKTYRVKAGMLADQFADIIVITNEDPYSENPEDIIEQVLSGIKNKILGRNLFRILDRKKAIKYAIDLAQKGDTVLITGKGSEQFMVWRDKMIPWDDRKFAREALEEKLSG